MKQKLLSMLLVCIAMMSIATEVKADGVLPEYTTDMDHPVYYRIKNLYQSKYAVYKGTDAYMTLTTDAKEASLFYFVQNGDDVNVRGLEDVTAPSVLIYAKDSGNKALRSANSWAENADGRHWYLYEKTNEGYHGFVMCYAETTDALKVGSTDTKIVYYGNGANGYNYKGSVFAVEKVEEGDIDEPEELIIKKEGEYDFINIAALKQVDGSVTTLTPTVESGVYTYSATGTLQFGFKHKNITIEGYDVLILEYEATSGGWCMQPKNGDLGGWTELSKDKTSYSVSIPEGTTKLGELSLFSLPWSTPSAPISVKAIKLHKIDTSKKVDADVTTFSKSKLNNNKWEFETPVDLSDYKYLIVTTVQSAGGKLNGYMILTDNTGKRAGNNWGGDLEINYSGEEAGTRGSMWLDRWNNQHCACINLEYLREKGLDVKNIVKFEVPHGENISAVYLTNYETGKAVSSTEGWGSCSGDYVREENALLENGKYGTIALKYGAAVSGAKLYTVDEWDDESGMMVLAEVESGIAEAGVPYIYVACDLNGHNADGDTKGSNSNVNFYRIDSNAISGDWSDNKGRDNGLVGYYDGGFWPGADALNGCYVISGNKLHKITGGDITLGKNRCFFDPGKYQGPKNSAGVKAYIGAFADDETAIKDVQAKSLTDGKIYDLKGRQVASMKKGGIYIMNGIKVVIK